MKIVFWAGFLVALLSGCATLSPKGQRVRITTNPDVVRGCEFLGNISGYSGWGGTAARSLGEEQVQIEMQNKTADIGGNVLFLISSRGGGYPRSKFTGDR